MAKKKTEKKKTEKKNEDFESYRPGEASVKFVVKIPENITCDPGWPSNKILKDCRDIYIQ